MKMNNALTIGLGLGLAAVSTGLAQANALHDPVSELPAAFSAERRIEMTAQVLLDRSRVSPRRADELWRQ